MSRLFDDASNQFLEVDATDITAAPLTMACWFYSDDNALQQGLGFIGDKDVSNQYFALLLTTTGKVAAATRQSSSTQAESTNGTAYTANAWHHACGVWSAANSRAAFLDGTDKGTEATSLTPTGADRISIAHLGDSSPSNPMSGRIAEFGIWTIALADADVALLAAGIPPTRVRPDALAHYWRIGIASPEPDWRGGATYNLALASTPTIADHPPVALPYGFDLGWEGAFTAAAAPATVIKDMITSDGIIAFPR